MSFLIGKGFFNVVFITAVTGETTALEKGDVEVPSSFVIVKHIVFSEPCLTVLCAQGGIAKNAGIYQRR